jgi:hypothetical protein
MVVGVKAVRLFISLAMIGWLTSCEPPAGHKRKVVIDNQSDYALRVVWDENAGGTGVGGKIVVEPHTVNPATIRSVQTCATKFLYFETNDPAVPDVAGKVTFSPDPWCYEKPLVITNVPVATTSP